MKRHVVVLGVIVIFLVLVWPTAFRYEHMGDAMVRINRLTGTYEVIEVDSDPSPHEDEAGSVSDPDTEVAPCGCPSAMANVTY